MVNNMWERDTLFLIFEEDFRFEPSDIEPAVSFEPTGLVELVGDQSTFLAAADAEIPGKKQAKPVMPGKGRWYEMPTKVTDHSAFVTSQTVLHDIVKYVTLAHRKCVGDMTWMCWQPGQAGSAPKRKGSPSSGSMFLTVSVPGAEILEGAMASGLIPKGHFDCKLLNWVRDLDATALRCCYMLPPMGNYATHESGCDNNYAGTSGGRPSCWKETWCCPGTRISEDPQRRDKWLCVFTSKGPPGWLSKLPNLDTMDDKELEWLTYWDVPGKSRPVAMEDLPNEEDQRGMPSTAGSSSRPDLQEPIVTSKRQRRKTRVQKLYHGLRCFTDDVAKALR
jgi:hypothetical protein